jgi:hypothetical protein
MGAQAALVPLLDDPTTWNGHDYVNCLSECNDPGSQTNNAPNRQCRLTVICESTNRLGMIILKGCSGRKSGARYVCRSVVNSTCYAKIAVFDKLGKALALARSWQAKIASALELAVPF